VAREIIERLVDDLDGGTAAETVVFGLDGTSYEIDLSKKNAAALRTSLDRFISAARRSGATAATKPRQASTPKARPSTASAKSKSKSKRAYDVAGLRAWAATNGIDVPARGRIPQATIELYKAELGR
jgi:hypothetical protein